MQKLYNNFFRNTNLSHKERINSLTHVFKDNAMPQKNLGTFSTTIMDKSIDKILIQSLKYNLVNKNEYKNLDDLIKECVRVFAELFNVPKEMNFWGVNTVGSAEACFIAGLNFLYLWKKRITHNNKNKPNIILGDNVHLVWYKFAKLFNVEAKIIKTQNSNFVIDCEEVNYLVDRNTIGICTTLGTTFTGSFDPIDKINQTLVKIYNNKKIFIPIHVDAASGSFVAPFKYPDLLWDFRLKHVISINVSSHKYGFIYPSQGWIIVKDKTFLADELFYSVPYLVGESKSVNLNFSTSSQFVIAQAYNFLKYGFKGYKNIIISLYKIRLNIIKELQEFNFIVLISLKYTLPTIVFSINNDEHLTERFSNSMFKLGWSIPTYFLPRSNTKIVRIVIRKDLNPKLQTQLICDLKNVLNDFDKILNKTPNADQFIIKNPLYVEEKKYA